MSIHVVVGAGPVGTRTALLLAESGERVRVMTRSGSGPEHPLVECVAADASDVDVLRRHSAGAVALYNCANPAYTRWDTDWPPIATALLDAAASSGAVLATVSNLYGYGRVQAPMGPQTPLAPSDHKGEVRVRMWRESLAAHEAGRVRVVEVRASDYADAGASSHLARNAYQFTAPFVVDDSATRRHVGWDAEPWGGTLARVVDTARVTVAAGAT